MRARLDRKTLVDAALELLQREGFDGVGMRRVAEHIGVAAPSLYKHVHDKSELLGWVADAICAEVPPLDPSQPWRVQLERMARQLRGVLLAHRDGARVLAATPPAGRHRLQLIEQVLGALRAAGFSPTRTVHAASSLNSYVIGFLLDETQAQGQESTLTDWLGALPQEDFPVLASLADRFASTSSEKSFLFGLEALLDGFARAHRRGAHSARS